jgi:hypothetical protein
MRRPYLFWGILLILLSALFALKAVGLIEYADIWGYFWPLTLTTIGAWMVVSVYIPRTGISENVTLGVDLQQAKEAKVKFSTGVGRMEISAGAQSGQLLSGTKSTGMNISQKMVGDRLEVDVGAGPSIFPFIGPEGGVWRFYLNNSIPLNLEIGSGASSLNLDLSDLKATYVKLETGASSVNLTTPKQAGNTLVDIEAGASSVDIHIPAQVGARIRVREGVSALDIDSSRFQRQDGGIYQSSDFDTSKNKVEISVETGVGKITIK